MSTKKSGPGHIVMAHVICKVTAERRLAIQLEDATGKALAHFELTQPEAKAFLRDLEMSIQKVWRQAGMSEVTAKGELFEKLEHLKEKHYYVQITLKEKYSEIRARNRDYKLVARGDGRTLTEALKAMPDA